MYPWEHITRQTNSICGICLSLYNNDRAKSVATPAKTCVIDVQSVPSRFPYSLARMKACVGTSNLQTMAND
jgi:hypothetical protein